MVARRNAILSSTYIARAEDYGAQLCIDGNRDSICASQYRRDNWLSIEVPADTPIGYVALWNRQHSNPAYNAFLGEFEIWVSRSEPGSTSRDSDAFCGRSSYNERQNAKPYVLWCSGAVGRFVTLKQVGGLTYMAIAELEAYRESRGFVISV